MEKFSRAELTWTAAEMRNLSEQLKAMSQADNITGTERSLYRLRSEQYKSIADKLAAAAKGKSCRIEISDGLSRSEHCR